MSAATVDYNGWPLGVDNVHSDYELSRMDFEDGYKSLRLATNCDIMDSGRVRTRAGFAPVSTLTRPHSLHSLGDTGLVMDGDTLYSITSTGLVSPLKVGLTPNVPVSYAEADGSVYFTCAAFSGMVRGGTVYEWGVEIPQVTPLASTAVGAGQLHAGTYTVCTTNIDLLGRESPASPTMQVAVLEGSTLTLSGIAAPVSPAVVARRVYVSAADGDVMLVSQMIPANVTTCVIATEPTGATLKTETKNTPPLGTSLAHCLGRIFIAVGKTVFFTDALNYSIVEVGTNFYTFPADVHVVAMRDGIFVASDALYFVKDAGSKNAVQRKILDVTVFQNTAAKVPNSTSVIVMSSRGAVLLSDDGHAKILAEGRYIPGIPTYTAAVVREDRGVRQYICNGGAVTPNQLAYRSTL